MFNYEICGLSVRSAIPLAGAVESAGAGCPTDIVIRRDAVPAALEFAIDGGPNWERDESRLLLRVPGVANLLIAGGREIIIAPEAGGTEDDVGGFVLGSGFGILLHQRGVAVLHGAAVARDGQAIVICGRSGAGKSTLAAALCQRGWTFLADDLCAITTDGDGYPLAWPDGRQLKLWRESIDALELAATRAGPVRRGIDKHFVQPSRASAAPVPLKAVYVLDDARLPDEAGIERLTGPDAMRALETESYRPAFRLRLIPPRHRFAQAAAIARHVGIHRFTRLRGFEGMGPSMAAMEAHLNGPV